MGTEVWGGRDEQNSDIQGEIRRIGDLWGPQGFPSVENRIEQTVDIKFHVPGDFQNGGGGITVQTKIMEDKICGKKIWQKFNFENIISFLGENGQKKAPEADPSPVVAVKLHANMSAATNMSATDAFLTMKTLCSRLP